MTEQKAPTAKKPTEQTDTPAAEPAETPPETEMVSIAPAPELFNRAIAWAGVEHITVTEKDGLQIEAGDRSIEWIANELLNGIVLAYVRETAGRGLSHVERLEQMEEAQLARFKEWEQGDDA